MLNNFIFNVLGSKWWTNMGRNRRVDAILELEGSRQSIFRALLVVKNSSRIGLF